MAEFNEDATDALLEKLKPENLSDSVLIKTAVGLLLGNKANPNAKYSDGKPIISQAISNLAAVEDNNGSDTIFYDRLNVVSSLLKNGAKLTGDDKEVLIRLVTQGGADELENLSLSNSKDKLLVATVLMYTASQNSLTSEDIDNLADYMGIIRPSGVNPSGGRRRTNRSRGSRRTKRRRGSRRTKRR